MKKRSLRISAATIDLKRSTEPLHDSIGRHTERGMGQELLGLHCSRNSEVAPDTEVDAAEEALKTFVCSLLEVA